MVALPKHKLALQGLQVSTIVQDSQGRWNQYTGRYAWDESCVCCGDEQYGGTGQPKEGSSFGAAPNVDHSNGRVRKVTGASPNRYLSSHLPSLRPLKSLSLAPDMRTKYPHLGSA